MLENYGKEFLLRFFLTTASILNFFCLGYVKKDSIMLYLLRLTQYTINNDLLEHFIFTDVTEILQTYLTILNFLITKIGIVLILYHSFSFFFAGLKLAEKKILRSGFLLINFMLIICFFFINKILFPYCWYFFIDYSQSIIFKSSKLFIESKVKDCVKLYVQIFYLTFLNFLILFFILKFSFFYKVKKRKYSTITVVFFVVLITPVDFTVQFLSVISVFIFYELIYFFLVFKCWIFNTCTKKYKT